MLIMSLFILPKKIKFEKLIVFFYEKVLISAFKTHSRHILFFFNFFFIFIVNLKCLTNSILNVFVSLKIFRLQI